MNNTSNNDISVLASTGRAKGVAAFAVNFEPGGQSPLDARLLVPTKADLINADTYASKNYYKGMAVTVEEDGTEYVLMDISKITEPDYSGWKQRDSMDTSTSLPNTVITDLTNVTTDSSTATIHSSKVTKADRTYGSAADDNIVIPAATSSSAGVMSAADKVKLDTTIPGYTVNTHKISSNPVLNSGDIKMDDYVEATGTSEDELTIKTTDTVGIALGKLQKQQLDNEEVVATALTKLNNSCGFDTNGNYNPSGSNTSGSTSLADAILKLDNAINSSSSSSSNYTVNGIKISSNPVLDGADIKITGYTQPSTTGALAVTDTVNGALGKLEKGLNDEISNRTAALTNLESEINNNINTKLEELESTIDGTITTQIDELQDNLTKEISDRTNADNDLRSQINSNKTTIDNYTVNSHKISGNPVLNSGDIKMDDYVEATGTSEDELTIKTTDTVGIAMGKLQKQQLDNEEVIATALTKLNSSCGFDTNGNYNPSGGITENSSSLAAAISDLDRALSTVQTDADKITSANFTLGSVTPTTTTVQISATKTNISTGSSVNNNITIPAVTESAAGVMSSVDKVKINDIQFVQSLTTTGTQVVSTTSDTIVINSTSQLNVIGINSSAYYKVRFVNATNINTLFTFNNSSAGNNKLLTTYYPSQITLPRYGSVEFVKSSTGWILSDLTGVTYLPDIDTDETAVVTVNPDRSIGTSPIRVMKDWDETVTNELSVSELNSRFPDAPIGFQFVCVSINRVYEKFNETNEWVSHFIWETDSEGTATTSKKGLMSAADKQKLDSISGTITTQINKIESDLAAETTNRTNAINNLRMFKTVTVNGTQLVADSNADTLTITAGSNVTLTPNATNDSFTISSSYVNTTYSAGTNLTLSGTTFALASTINLTRVNASSGFYQQSDERLKSDIKPLEHTLEDICSIPTDSFILNGKQDLGTIAQEVEKKFPELVEECELPVAEIPNPENFDKVEKDGETYVLVKEVDYAKLSVLALEGVKLLKAEIDKLKEELKNK